MPQDAVVTSIRTQLDGLSAKPSDCCIFRIHKPLRQVNEQAYDPEIVAIGPYHRENKNLKIMEEHKLRYFHSLLQRKKENDASRYVNAIRPLQQKESWFYAKPMSLTADEMIQIMVLDGCFIIELLRKYDMEHLRDQDDPIFKLIWMVNSLKRDLMLFENQLPFSILRKLFDLIEAPNNHSRLIYLALRFFNDLLPGTYEMKAGNSHGNIRHLLELVHNEWLPLSVSTAIANVSSVSTPIGNASSVSISVSTPIGNASSVSTTVGNASSVSTSVSTTPIGNTSSASTTIENASSVSMPIGNASSVSATIGTASSVSMPIGNVSSVSATIGTASSVSAPIGNASSVSMTIGTASSVSTSVSTPIGNASSVSIPASTPIGNASSVSTTVGNASSVSPSVSTPIGNTSSASTTIGNASSVSMPIGNASSASATIATASSVSMPIRNVSSVSATIGTASSVSAPIANASSVSMTIGTASSVSTSVSTPIGNASSVSIRVSTPLGNASSVSTTVGNASSVSTSMSTPIVNTSSASTTIGNASSVSKPIGNALSASATIGKGNWRFIPNTTELQEAGVKLKKSEVAGGSLFDIEFDKGKLCIPPLTVEDRTESIFRNLIAYEQYCPDNQRSYVTDYVKFLDCLIDSPKDVEILSGLGIIDNWLGDDEAVSNIFNKISDAVSGTSMHFRYADIFNRVNIYCRQPCNRWMANLNRKYCNGPWAVISVLAGSVLLVLTLAQTLYAVFPFRKL
ncbi:hypothetical protein ACSBR2_026361 [Camellia fascicularis]